MLTVGTLTLFTSVIGSCALGGTAAGAIGIGAAGAPVFGALAGRSGHRPVLVVAGVLNALAVVALIMAAYTMPAAGAFPAAAIAAAFVSGASCPQVGPMARVRWLALTSRGSQSANIKDLDTALSYESTADELTFVLGPALVGVLASLVAPWLPLALAGALTLRPSPGSLAAVALPVLGMVSTGTFFGSTQTALSAFSASFAGSEMAGLLYAVMGLSSAVAALSVAYWPGTFTPSARWLVSAAPMAALAFLLLVPASAGGMVLVLLILGLPVGPVMVTVITVGGQLAPAGRLVGHGHDRTRQRNCCRSSRRLFGSRPARGNARLLDGVSRSRGCRNGAGTAGCGIRRRTAPERD